MMKKKLSILGSTGSIGTQSLEICSTHDFDVVGLVAYSNEKLLEEQVRRFHPEVVCICDENRYQSFRQRIRDLDVTVLTGIDGLCEVASWDSADMVLNSVMGMVGLRPTLAAIHAGKDIALANKETLVTGGKLVMEAVKENNVRLLPVDSEHSAIFQSLQGYQGCKVNKILLTASGGPFFGKKRQELLGITPAQALKHPNWSMGAKITIDSATMMNKGLELIEACWLFDLQPSQIQVVIHRESVIHSMVEFVDHSVIGQMGVPDMKIPIQYALTYPNRVACPVKPLDLFSYGKLTFYQPDEETFKPLALARKAFEMGGLYPTLLNSANERLVELFLKEKITFLQIGDILEQVLMEKVDLPVTVENILETEQMGRHFADSHIK